jgi:hypothetical protein
MPAPLLDHHGLRHRGSFALGQLGLRLFGQDQRMRLVQRFLGHGQAICPDHGLQPARPAEQDGEGPLRLLEALETLLVPSPLTLGLTSLPFRV